MEPNSKKLEHRSRTRMQWAMTLLVNTTVFTYGLQWGWVSPMAKILQSNESPTGRPLTDAEISLVAGVPSLAAILCIPILLYFVDKHGRKICLIMMAVAQLIGWIIKIFPGNIYTLLIARAFFGFGAAGCFHVVPMYVKEISQDHIRGTLGSLLIMFQNLGVLIMYGIGGYYSYYTVLYLVTGISILSSVMLIKAPDSPSFLVNQGKLQKAAAAVGFLRSLDPNDKEVQSEIDLIKKEDDYFKSIPNISFFSIFKNKAWRHGFVIMWLIALVRGLNGAYTIVSYATTLLDNPEINISPEIQSLVVPISMTIGTAVTMSTVDRIGRRVLLGVTLALTTLIFAALATSVLLHDRGWATPVWLPIVAVILIMCLYGAGPAPLFLIIMTEIFNFEIRGKLTAFLCTLGWFMSFVQLVCYSTITNAFGVSASFYTFSGINLVGLIIVLVLLPETKGETVEQIEKKLIK